MPLLRTQLVHLILHILCALCLVIVEVEPVAVYKECPVTCICSPDDHVPRTWALEADCRSRKVPPLTPNITSLEIQNANSIGEFAFSSARSLWKIAIGFSNPIMIHRNAFQFLPNLQELTLKRNMLTLDSGLFRHLQKLTFLNLMGIGLQHVPSERLCDLVHIERIFLESNNISSVSFHPCVWKAWTRISTLKLSHNPLKIIQADDFYNLRDHNVTELFLDDCGLTDLHPDLFQHLPRLTLLDISMNRIRFLPPGLLRYLSNLRNLSIALNQLASLTFADNYPFMPVLQTFCSSDNIFTSSSHSNVSFSRAFLSATSLHSLDIFLLHTGILNELVFANLIKCPVTKMTLTLSHVKWISGTAFDPLHSLQTLQLTSSRVEPEAMHNMFLSLGRLPLKTLEIFMFQQALDNRTFDGFLQNSNLSYLNLDSNEIEKIGRDTFQYLNNLETLILSHNRLENDGLEDGAFRGLDSLQILDLSDNQLIFLPGRFDLEISSNLRALDLSGNQLTSLSVYLREWSNLKVLLLERNEIANSILPHRFQGMNNLEILSFSSNRLSSVEPGAFWGMASLKKIYLNDNVLGELPGSVFGNSNVLEELYLQDNPLSQVAKYVSLNLSSLIVLQLSGGEISDLQDEMFNNNQMLKELYLNDNFIVSWRPEVFRPLRNLTDLAMANNKIADVPQTAFTYLTSLARLDLSGNPLACTCKLLWFKHWISTTNVYLLGYTIKERYTCASPELVKNTPLLDFQLTVDDCASHFVLNLTVGSISGILFVSIVLSLTHRFRWYIRYYIFLVRSRRRQMYDTLVDDETFKYDVYVCYHNTSRHWVINELLPKLEHEAGIKLCLHDRNWLAGPTIMDNIIESIEHSRKTLLLVNNGFAQSGWCREETSLAYHRLIETQRNMLVVVLLEDVKQGNMDKLLRSILTKRVYLKYSQSTKKEHRFWKALKAALRKGEQPAAGMELQRA